MRNQYPASNGITKDQIEYAMRHTQSCNGAARYLGISIVTYKKYASMYFDEETGKNLYELHLNRSGLGISRKREGVPEPEGILMDILSGKVIPKGFTPEKLKDRLIKEALLKEECACCGFKERRVHDYKVPLLLTFRDGNKSNWQIDNLELLCYNDFFLQVGDIFNKKQVEAIEGVQLGKTATLQQDLQIEDTHISIVEDIYKSRGQEDTSGESLLFKM